MAKTGRTKPNELTSSWPDVPSTDPAGEMARRFTLKLQAAMGDRGVRDVARDAGINHSTLISLLAGKTWPDFLTMARLETALHTQLWPGTVELHGDPDGEHDLDFRLPDDLPPGTP